MMLVELICKVACELRRGKVTMRMDRKQLIRAMTTEPTKPNQYVQDCRAIKSRFGEIKRLLNIDIVIKYSSKNIKKCETFEDNRGGFSMNKSDTQSKSMR